MKKEDIKKKKEEAKIDAGKKKKVQSEARIKHVTEGTHLSQPFAPSSSTLASVTPA